MEYKSRLSLTFNFVVNFLSSKKFLYSILGVFIIQASVAALMMGEMVFPDEYKHFGRVEYTANLSWWQGPFVLEQDPQTLWFGDVERSPTVLYYYLAGLVTKIVYIFTSDHLGVLIAIRFLSVLTGVASLYIFSRLLHLLSTNRLIVNLATLGLSFTAMFLFVNAQVGYDSFSNLLFFLFILTSVKFIQTKELAYCGLSLSLSLALLLTKQTYAPILLVGDLVLAIYFIAINKFKTIPSMVNQLQLYWKNYRGRMIAYLALTSILLGLFFAYFGYNIVAYRSISPACEVLHKQDDCMKLDVYKREYEQQQGIASGRVTRYQEDNFILTGQWLERMYRTLFYFGGHVNPVLTQHDVTTFFILSVTVLIPFFLPRRPLINSLAIRYVMGIAIFYVVILYLFNMNTWYVHGAQFAWQGRYLVPIIGFIFFLALLISHYHLDRIKPAGLKKVNGALALTVIVYMTAYYNPLYTTYTHGDISWLNNPAQDVYFELTQFIRN